MFKIMNGIQVYGYSKKQKIGVLMGRLVAFLFHCPLLKYEHHVEHAVSSTVG